ncbi:hypothetical protein SFR_5092 [Streptomyces sp. FR-008]|nr:hypothetical protein SFR_5092 [Streptomyces sp. FR-008]
MHAGRAAGLGDVTHGRGLLARGAAGVAVTGA